MNTSRDRFDTLVALRPRSIVEQTWPAAERAAAHDHIVALAADGPVASHRWRWSKRVTVVALLTGALVPAGLGVAAAGGALPDFSHYFSFWKSDAGVDPATATRAATAPGPDGTVFAVWTARGRGMECFAPLFETPHSAATPDPSEFQGSGSSCAPIGLKNAFGATRAITGDDTKATYEVSAGDTARAELKLPDGTRRPAVQVKGRYFGWYTNGLNRTVDLVAYNTDGTVAGTVELLLSTGPR